MPFMIAVGLAIAFGVFFPRASNVMAWVLTLGFIGPFFALAVGTVTWSIGFIVGVVPFGLESWKTCMLFLGCPAGILMGAHILKE